jgi:hypothetical protein
MGSGCSNSIVDTTDIKNFKKLRSSYVTLSTMQNKKINSTIYHNYQYKNVNISSLNFVMFTSMNNLNNEFTAVEGDKKDNPCYNSYKIPGVAIGYSKGYKLDVHNQDKFFILIDGNVEVYCMLDGHGPYGNVIAQYAQDLIFKVSIMIILVRKFRMIFLIQNLT